jgi:hypothetical protein
MPFLRKYGTGTGADIIIPIPKRGVVDFALSADWTPASGDVKINIDNGGAANIATLPVAVTMGNTAGWKFVFSNAELQGKRIEVSIADSATKAVEDQFFIVETYGNASAMYPPDFSDATRLGLTALPNAAAEASGGLYTRGTGAGQINQDANGRIDTNTKAAAGTAVTLDANNVLNVSTKYVGGTLQTARDLGLSVLLSSGTGTGQISLSSGAVLLQATQTGVTIPTVTTLTNLPSIPANWITAAGITDGAFTTAKFAASSLNGKGDWSTTAPLDAAGTRSALGLATNNLDTQLTAIGNSAASAASSAGSAASSSSSAAASAGTAVTQTTAGAVRTAVGLASANLDTQLGDIKTDTGNLLTRITSTLFSGITSLKQWLGMLAGKQAGDSTAITEIRATGAGSGTFNPTTDSGEAIRDRGDAAWTTGTGGGGGGSAGDGDTPVNHNTGGADTYRVLDNLSAPVDNARLTAYVKADYDADPTTATRQAAAYTGADGRWVDPMMLNTGTAYTIVVDKPGSFDPYTFDVTP